MQQDDPSFIERLGNSLSGWWNSNNSTRDTEELAAIKGSSLGYRMAEGKTKPRDISDSDYRNAVSAYVKARDEKTQENYKKTSPQWKGQISSGTPRTNNAIESVNDSRIDQAALQSWLNPPKIKTGPNPASYLLGRTTQGNKLSFKPVDRLRDTSNTPIPMRDLFAPNYRFQPSSDFAVPSKNWEALTEEEYAKTMQEDGGPAINPEYTKAKAKGETTSPAKGITNKSVKRDANSSSELITNEQLKRALGLDKVDFKSLGAKIKEKLGIKSK